MHGPMNVKLIFKHNYTFLHSKDIL